ncbi:MAG: ORC1-type DNA replication protein [Candidatus Woesearchaeota archaeon]|nr:MAG: ORC1-type DNA replication protein [Candidatus Woesearchaeota archaeon]
MSKNLTNLFEKFLEKQSLFTNKKALQSIFIPDAIKHRDKQIEQIAEILAPALREEKPSNIFIYGKTGTGKTLSVRHTVDEMKRIAEEKDIRLKIIYVNCKLKKIADTEYRMIAELSRSFGKAVPPTGLPTDEVYNIFYHAVEEQNSIIILVLDEIDQLINRAGDEIIYNLTRINSDLKKSQLSLVGISNDLMFANNIDPRVKSSLSEEELVFPPYNAPQIRDILEERSKIAFKEDVIEEGVIAKCAAYAAREHGDARRALELLRVAGEIAERNAEDHVQIKHIDFAEDKIEKDRIIDIVQTQPKQFQNVLFPILVLKRNNPKEKIYTGDIYEIYKSLCIKTNIRPLTQRRISDIISELDMLGIINAKIISKGRFGRTKEISLSLPSPVEKTVFTLLTTELGVDATQLL